MTVERLAEYGVTRMDDGEIRDFLASQRSGILGLPADEAPYLLPLSFGFDGEEELYFTYVTGDESRKRTLSDRADRARFLVYSATSAYVWESVLLTGTISEVHPDERAALEDVLANAWRPELFETAFGEETVSIYRFRIDERRGFRHSGLPPGLKGDRDE